MSERLFHAGIDFGTSQTKVCIQHTSSRPAVHEFLRFGGARGASSLFLPTRVWAHADGTLAFGHRPDSFEGSPLEYFKIVSAQDLDFRTAASEYGPLTPEVLSVCYVAHVILAVREHVRALSTPTAPRRGLLRRKRAAAPLPFRITAQLGYPTEYLSPENTPRRLKFEAIFVLADALADHYGTVEALGRARATELQAFLSDQVNRLANGGRDGGGERLRAELGDRGLSVFPESAAGLASLVRTGRLDPGYYASLDIGGGSTDASFFRVNENGSTSYLASETVFSAANDVYRAYAGEEGGAAAMGATATAESRVRRLIASGNALTDKQYRRAICAVTSDVYWSMYKAFNGRVYRLFDRGQALTNRALGTYRGRPCFVYGGGGALPVPKGPPGMLERIKVHDNGRPHSLDESNFTRLRREPLDGPTLAPHAPVFPNGPDVPRSMALLAVAYGLSHPHRAVEALWDRDDYKSTFDLAEVPHPVNAGMYVYDVVERAWR